MLVDADRFTASLIANARRMLVLGINEKACLQPSQPGKDAVKITITLNVNARYVLLDRTYLGSRNYQNPFTVSCCGLLKRKAATLFLYLIYLDQ